ncbi:MAG: hypothetical protein CVU29_08530 [Betaproteobacteria bacterium HGW-Betaproteobacteria-22]|nr:MAG: hypothetical protein CVU29_08530 [Betaproteobacteria bacterium HGW-Betaproteobacteria-22]
MYGEFIPLKVNYYPIKSIGWELIRGDWIGVVPLATGLLNFCGLYALLGVNTCKVK